MDLAYLIKALQRKKWIILFAGLLGFGAGVAFTLIQKQSYISDAQYSTGITQSQKISLQLTDIFDVNQIDIRFNNVIETIQSETVLGMLSYELLLHDLESAHPFRVLTAKQKKDTVYRNVDFQKTKEILHNKLVELTLLNTYNPDERRVWDLVNLYEYDQFHLAKKIVVERVKSSDFLNIEFTSENPELSAFVVNTIGIKFKEFYNSLTSSRNKESLTKIDSLRRAKAKVVDSFQQKLEKFRSTAGATKTGDVAGAAISSLQDANSQLTAEKTKLNTLNNQLDAVNNQLNTLNVTGTPTQTPAVVNNNDEYIALRSANQGLLRQLSEKGGIDKDLQAKIDANQKRMEAILASRPSTAASTPNSTQKTADKKEDLITKKLNLEADIKSTKENILLYEDQVEKARTLAFSGGGKEVVLNAMQTDYENARKELDKYNATLFASQDLDVNPDFNFKQIVIGLPPIKPQSSHRTLVVLAAAIAMIFISCLTLLILEFVDTSLRTPSIFQKESKLKLLTSINKIDLEKKSLKDYFDLSEESFKNKGSETFLEGMRKLRFELENSGKKIILVTSLKEGEGKTTVLEAMAYTFSLTKKKVLLIDTNFSNNTLSQRFNAKPTLENFNLSVQDNAIDKIWGITTLTNIINTDVIGCNSGNYTPTEILPKNNLLMNLGKITQHYDFIFMEGAAFSDHTDSKELSKYVDGIILVQSARNAIGERDKESIQFLNTVTADKFIGAILNKVDQDLMEV